MSEKVEEKKKDEKKTKDVVKAEKISRRAIAVAVIGIILAVVGMGFGIYGTIQANKTSDESISDEEEDFDDEDGEEITADYDEGEAEDEFAKPTSADEIAWISLAYDNGDKAIDVYKEDMEVYYYTANDEAESGWDVETKDIDGKIFNYVFDNDVQYLDRYEELENETWFLEVGMEEGASYANGEGEMPDWFKALLKELGV
ncbi:hypothetical protein J6X04_03345 [Candidatus Saccharibacteria bacterium]|nr:hypothetical protein [Candidatus Saccharibacteria bacterium]